MFTVTNVIYFIRNDKTASSTRCFLIFTPFPVPKISGLPMSQPTIWILFSPPRCGTVWGWYLVLSPEYFRQPCYGVFSLFPPSPCYRPTMIQSGIRTECVFAFVMGGGMGMIFRAIKRVLLSSTIWFLLLSSPPISGLSKNQARIRFECVVFSSLPL